MSVDELLPYLGEHRLELLQQIRDGKYKFKPVRRVEIPKEEKENSVNWESRRLWTGDTAGDYARADAGI